MNGVWSTTVAGVCLLLLLLLLWLWLLWRLLWRLLLLLAAGTDDRSCSRRNRCALWSLGRLLLLLRRDVVRWGNLLLLGWLRGTIG